jgi:anhydro-N-acetylmuramic acid kinase
LVAITIESQLYIGIMSGTSLDGIDVALVEISDGQVHIIGTHYQAYAQPLKHVLLALHHPSNNELHQAQLAGNELARLYAKATAMLLQENNIASDRIRAIGCHGQTIRHRPEHGYTVQLGNAALLAELTGITVVGDFRSRDIAAGGQGAPLVPAFHDKALRHPGIHRVIVNVGGISNLTDLPPDRPTTGFDCGPGCLLMDSWCMQHLVKPYDEGGAWAATGKVLPVLLEQMFKEDFFALPPPKSSGRDLFNMAWLQEKLNGGERAQDVQATLLELTCRSIAQAIQQHCSGAEEIYLCGGGAHNNALLALLERALPRCSVQLTDALGISADWMEAIAFAWLAHQTMHGESSSLPAVTGARHPCILGAIYQA